MSEISNRTLTILLVLAIIASVGGTIVNISKINNLILRVPITGKASTAVGYVNITISEVASIATIDNIIDFGSCSPNATYGTNVTSNISGDWGAPGVCSSIPVGPPDNITLKNDGNIFINVTVESDKTGADLIGGDDPFPPTFELAADNNTDDPGCVGVLQDDWFTVSATGTEYNLCDNLTKTKKLYVYAKLRIPANAPTSSSEKSAKLTFHANDLTQ